MLLGHYGVSRLHPRTPWLYVTSEIKARVRIWPQRRKGWLLHKGLYMQAQRRAVTVLLYGFALLSVSSWAAFAWGQVAGPEVYQALEAHPKVRVVIVLRRPTTPPSALTSRRAEIAAMQSKVLSQLGTDEFTLTHRWEALNAMAGEVSRSGF